ncbi:MAG: hypothetical protein K9L95_05035 [Candidatus Omnitrophica bacterium]|nr:hypothetical protein [Candidatus Omnitrophota bacterium]MCF7877605.1 hypothetical protein [Candidatus Omnitrophota bacterium]MCF7878814.1 hypothetical protein [Candidatus Omnitrophota bacterium]MCF7893039.1 hypothetical protein [Candidatus Omnitrophota bacterium]
MIIAQQESKQIFGAAEAPCLLQLILFVPITITEQNQTLLGKNTYQAKMNVRPAGIETNLRRSRSSLFTSTDFICSDVCLQIKQSFN